MCAILKSVAACAAKTKESQVIRLSIGKPSHPKPPTLVRINSTTTIGIVNSTIKKKWSQLIEIRDG
jgi:hypothetical protein